jgi:hypothetical protein
VEAPLIDLAL